MPKSRRKKRKTPLGGFLRFLLVVIILLILVTALVPGVREKLHDLIWPPTTSTPKDDVPVISSGNVSIHFLELGNKYTGDSTYIKVGDTDILIDAGSRENSAAVIGEYLNQYVTDGVLEYVIVTHADRDHIAGFAKEDGSIFDQFTCENIIDFALTNKGSGATYQKYLSERQAEIDAGANHLTAREVRESGNFVYTLDGGVTMTILDNKYYYEASSDENNYSVCMLLQDGDQNFLFTGDLEKDGEAALVQLNQLPQVDLFKAGHHGSYTSSTDALLSVIQPKIVCVCCCAGSTEYTTNIERVFPSQDFCNRIAPYTDRVYVTTMVDDTGNFTAMNGTIVITTKNSEIVVQCSADQTVLKDSEWFKKYRTCPEAWK